MVERDTRPAASGVNRTAVGAALCLVVGNGPVMQFAFGAFLLPLARALGADRGTVSAALTVGLVATGLATPAVGLAVDRFGVRRVATTAVLAFAGLLAGIGLLVRTPAGLFAGYALLGLAAAGQSPLPYARAVAAASDVARRGRALGIAMAGVGVGTMLVPAAAGLGIAVAGWRAGYVMLGGLVLVVALPALRLIGPAADRPAATPALRQEARRRALRDPAFGLLGLLILGWAAATSAVLAHLVPMAVDRGLRAPMAGLAIGTAGAAMIVGRLGAGWLLDRWPAARTGLLFTLFPMGGVGLLLGSTGGGTVFPAAAMVGLAVGAEADLLGYFLSRLFDLAAFGTLYGYLFALFMIGNGLGPWAMGRLFADGGYAPGLWAAEAVLAGLCGLLVLLGRRPYVAV